MKIIKEAPKVMRTMTRSTSTMLEFPQGGHVPAPAPGTSGRNAKLDNPRVYQTHKTSELLRAYSVLKLSSYQTLVNNAESLISTSRSILGDNLTRFAIKKTMYEHFCGGETQEEVKRKSEEMKSKGLLPILDYSVEAHVGEASSTDKAESTLISKLEQFKLVDGCVANGISPIKPSSLCNPDMLKHLTSYLLQNSVDFSTISSNFTDDSEDSFVNAVCEEVKDVTLLQDMEKYARNLYKIGSEASKLNERVLIDAEYFSFQPAIDYFALKAMQFFNKDKVVFLNTFQCYLKQTSSHLDKFIDNSLKENYCLGAKLVRGAYMNHERSVNSVSPVHDTIQDTHDCYNENSAKLIQLIKDTEGKTGVVFATHNLESAKKIYGMLGILTNHERAAVQFAQLNGMADDVTHFLLEKGESPLKLIPYGPLEDVLPYLIRRAQENNSILGQTKVQRKEMLKEMGRRIFLI